MVQGYALRHRRPGVATRCPGVGVLSEISTESVERYPGGRVVRDSENGLDVEGRKGVTGGRGWEPEGAYG